MKTELTQDDYNRLNAARGLDLTAKGGRNHAGLKPSVEVYNEAIKRGIYCGVAIIPCDQS